MDAVSPADTWARESGVLETAPAKINLALHVTGQRPDGYHMLDSLVVFAAEGDRLHVSPSDTDRLDLAGPFAAALPAARDNIVLRALDCARAVMAARGHTLDPLRIELDKRLPLAAGIGGGSADAAALLRVLLRHAPALGETLRADALRLGADVPMCLDGIAARVCGIGEVADPLAALPRLSMLLVNPGTPVSTPAVFTALARRDNPPLPPVPEFGFPSLNTLVDWLGETRNDLEAPALSLAPAIGEALILVREAGARFARMSGSGATVFALFEDDVACHAAARHVAVCQPNWWVLPTHVAATGVSP